MQWTSFVAAAVFVVWILYARGDQLRSAFELTPVLFWAISIACFVTFAVNGIELKVLASRFGGRVPVGEAMLLGLMVNTLNYLPMKAGTLLNGAIIRARYRVRLEHFGSLVAGSSVIHLWAALTLAGAALLIEGTSPLWAWAFLLGPAVFVAALMVWGRSRTEGRLEEHPRGWLRVSGRIIDGVGLMFRSGRLLAIEIVINLTLVLLASLRTWLAFKALSSDASMASAVVVTAVGIVFARLSVIPGGLGFKETGAALGSTLSGVPAGVGFAATFVERAVMLVWLLLLGVPATLYMERVTGVHLADAEAGDEATAEGVDP